MLLIYLNKLVFDKIRRILMKQLLLGRLNGITERVNIHALVNAKPITHTYNGATTNQFKIVIVIVKILSP